MAHLEFQLPRLDASLGTLLLFFLLTALTHAPTHAQSYHWSNGWHPGKRSSQSLSPPQARHEDVSDVTDAELWRYLVVLYQKLSDAKKQAMDIAGMTEQDYLNSVGPGAAMGIVSGSDGEGMQGMEGGLHEREKDLRAAELLLNSYLARQLILDSYRMEEAENNMRDTVARGQTNKRASGIYTPGFGEDLKADSKMQAETVQTGSLDYSHVENTKPEYLSNNGKQVLEGLLSEYQQMGLRSPSHSLYTRQALNNLLALYRGLDTTTDDTDPRLPVEVSNMADAGGEEEGEHEMSQFPLHLLASDLKREGAKRRLDIPHGNHKLTNNHSPSRHTAMNALYQQTFHKHKHN